MKRQAVRRSAVVVVGFALFLGLAILIGAWLGQIPSPQKACNERCALQNKQGQLVYSGPATPKQGYKDANSTCECR